MKESEPKKPSLLQALIPIVGDSGLSLVIKCHPKDINGQDPVLRQPYNRLLSRKLTNAIPSLPDHVQIDDENRWDTSSLMENADCVVTMNSQAGLEAALDVVTDIART